MLLSLKSSLLFWFAPESKTSKPQIHWLFVSAIRFPSPKSKSNVASSCDLGECSDETGAVAETSRSHKPDARSSSG